MKTGGSKLVVNDSIAAFVISETITHVPYIGGDIQMATITENEGFKIIGTTEIKAIQAQIENRVGFPLIADWICQS